MPCPPVLFIHMFCFITQQLIAVTTERGIAVFFVFVFMKLPSQYLSINV